ncbi:MAG: glycerol-3-phosphate dehydrogenase/oxidase [Acidimicrobiales bacterium]
MAHFQRAESLANFSTVEYDVVVVGAGMTGAGVALDAASRGLRVALLDAGDIASGTSSKSSKMVHGGLRYLQQKEFRLVYENLRERQRLLENAPFLVRPLPFLIPLFGRDGAASKALVKGYATALRIYDLTGGWRIGARYRKVTRDQALSHLPTLHSGQLVAGFIYMDARGDDARVALTLARSAALDFGADVANYLRVTGFSRDDDGRVREVVCHDQVAGTQVRLRTRTVVNASGVWADDVFNMIGHTASHEITPAKGVHVTVPRHRLPADVAAVLTVPGDRRSIFVVPFEEAPYTFIGTTDTAYEGSLEQPECSRDDVAYLLNAVNAWTSSDLSAEDVTGLWAGLRPLLAPKKGETMSVRTADLSRRHKVTDSHDGVIHVTGGKWTTYRQMAEDGVDALKPYFAKLAPTKTKHLRLHGTSSWRPQGELETHLYQRFGADAQTVLGLVHEDPTLGELVIDGLPFIGAEFIYSARHEMATSLIDLLTRRTRAHLHNARTSLAAAPKLARLVANTLGWDEDQIASQLRAYETLVTSEFMAAGITVDRS